MFVPPNATRYVHVSVFEPIRAHHDLAILLLMASYAAAITRYTPHVMTVSGVRVGSAGKTTGERPIGGIHCGPDRSRAPVSNLSHL